MSKALSKEPKTPTPIFEISTGGDGHWSKEKRKVGILDVEIGMNEMRVYFDTSTWDVKKHGLIYTDETFLSELKKIVNRVDFDYSENGLQGNNYVHFDVLRKTKKIKNSEEFAFYNTINEAAHKAWEKSKNGKALDLCLFEELEKKGVCVPRH